MLGSKESKSPERSRDMLARLLTHHMQISENGLTSPNSLYLSFSSSNGLYYSEEHDCSSTLVSRAKVHWETPAGPEYRKALISYTLIRGWLSGGQTLNPK